MHERKQTAVVLEEEILRRQKAEQDMRIQALNTATERMEREAQSRQLQDAMEMEVQRREELSRELELEKKQRRKEMQQIHQLEMRVQEEAEAKEALELELKQADLQSQTLQQELRQRLSKLQRVLSTQDTDSGECCTGDSNAQGVAGDENESDDEKLEIRLLLLEEFQRLQPPHEQDKLSEQVTAVSTTDTHNRYTRTTFGVPKCRCK